MLTALPRYRIGRVPFNAWLFRIARNAATDRQRKHHMLSLHWVPQALLPPMESDLEAGILHREALSRLGQIISALDTRSRELLRLRFVAELTVPEIAAVAERVTLLCISDWNGPCGS